MHPGAVSVPAALAMAERHGTGGTALLRALALGYDMCVRFSFALGAYAFSDAGYDTHGYGGTFGAAAAAGSIAGLNADQVRYLLSYAAQQASGLSDFPRDTQHIEKAFNFGGRPAKDGVTAATMVAMGMTGIDDVFSGDKNFFAAFGPQVKPDEIVRELGVRFDVMRTSIKKWSVGNPAQAPLDSLHHLIKANRLKAADIDKVVVRLDRVGSKTVNNRSMPDINLQYLASVMLLDGTLTLVAAHDVVRMRNPQVLALMKRVELIGDEEMTHALPARHAVVEVKLRDGRELRQLTTQVRGTPGNPVTREEIAEKTLDLCAPVLGKGRARELIEAVWQIEKVTNVRKLRPLLQA
jgi:2-methylcitrate dehydratase PrpD